MARPVPRFIPITLNLPTFELRLEFEGVQIIQENHARADVLGDFGSDDRVVIVPSTVDEAHDLALAFRKAARRLEEIGRGMK
jgi:hypothetical protein